MLLLKASLGYMSLVICDTQAYFFDDLLSHSFDDTNPIYIRNKYHDEHPQALQLTYYTGAKASYAFVISI